MTWSQAREMFAWDGSFRDLYVLNTTLDDWKRCISFLEQSPYRLQFSINDEPQPPPIDVSWVFAHRNEIGVLLSIYVHDMLLNCHFFWEEEIEFDLDPREVTDEAHLHHVLQFMQGIGLTLNKEVRLTAENSPEAVIYRFRPESGAVEYVGW